MAERVLDRAETTPAEPSPTIERPAGQRRRSPVDAWRQQFLDAGPIDVSVCIANWNCRDLLRACLESLHDQPQGVRLETIVVDNASTDGAADMVADEFPEVLLIRNETNRGFARANNQAAQRASGRYLFFLNNDTLIPPHALGRLLEYAQAHPEAGLVGPRLRDGQGRTQVSYRLRPTMATFLHRTALLRWTGLLREHYRRYRRLEFDPEHTRSVEVLMGAAVLAPRRVFFDCGRWDEAYIFGGEDINLSLKIGQRHQVVYHPGVHITHFGRASTRQHIGYVSSHMATGFALYLRKSGYSPVAMTLYKLIVTFDTPVMLVAKGIEYLGRCLGGRPAKAEKSLLALRGCWQFLTRGLATFWRA